MPLSPLALESAFAPSTEQVWLILMEITHPDSEPIYLVNNTVDIVIGAKTYLAYPFNIVLAPDDGETLPKVKLSIDNVDRSLVETVRLLDESPQITLLLVLSGQTDVAELEISGMVLREVDYDAYSITGTLYADDILNSRYPKDVISLAAGYLGQFK